MKCPRCYKDDVSIVSDTHYVCNNPECVDDHGHRTQFRFIPDERIRFPYNQIFVDRLKNEFFRKPFLELNPVGVKKT